MWTLRACFEYRRVRNCVMRLATTGLCAGEEHIPYCRLGRAVVHVEGVALREPGARTSRDKLSSTGPCTNLKITDFSDRWSGTNAVDACPAGCAIYTSKIEYRVSTV